MKKLLVVSFMLITGLAYGSITDVDSSTKIAQSVKQIYSVVDNARNSVGSLYSKSKDYITAHPTQFTTEDKNKLTGLQTQISATDTAISNLKTYITTEWPGINE